MMKKAVLFLAFIASNGSAFNFGFDAEQQILQFTASLTAYVGDEFRATIVDSCSNKLWNGTIQCYASQSIDKPVYKNQNTSGSFISNDTANEYIILT